MRLAKLLMYSLQTSSKCGELCSLMQSVRQSKQTRRWKALLPNLRDDEPKRDLAVLGLNLR